ncbi:MAG: hypothetical protein JNK72_21545 [Myxococcales bacterium]|nr:hypothetical protein [Myxococcales bacterium]
MRPLKEFVNMRLAMLGTVLCLAACSEVVSAGEGDAAAHGDARVAADVAPLADAGLAADVAPSADAGLAADVAPSADAAAAGGCAFSQMVGVGRGSEASLSVTSEGALAVWRDPSSPTVLRYVRAHVDGRTLERGALSLGREASGRALVDVSAGQGLFAAGDAMIAFAVTERGLALQSPLSLEGRLARAVQMRSETLRTVFTADTAVFYANATRGSFNEPNAMHAPHSPDATLTTNVNGGGYWSFEAGPDRLSVRSFIFGHGAVIEGNRAELPLRAVSPVVVQGSSAMVVTAAEGRTVQPMLARFDAQGGGRVDAEVSLPLPPAWGRLSARIAVGARPGDGFVTSAAFPAGGGYNNGLWIHWFGHRIASLVEQRTQESSMAVVDARYDDARRLGWILTADDDANAASPLRLRCVARP